MPVTRCQNGSANGHFSHLHGQAFIVTVRYPNEHECMLISQRLHAPRSYTYDTQSHTYRSVFIIKLWCRSTWIASQNTPYAVCTMQNSLHQSDPYHQIAQIRLIGRIQKLLSLAHKIGQGSSQIYKSGVAVGPIEVDSSGCSRSRSRSRSRVTLADSDSGIWVRNWVCPSKLHVSSDASMEWTPPESEAVGKHVEFMSNHR